MALPLVVADAVAQLAYARSRAPAFSAALSAFRAGAAAERQRARAMGRAAHRRLLAVEQACYHAGLLLQFGPSREALPPAAMGRRAAAALLPWRLPSDLAERPVDSLPAHPLIHLPTLAALAAQRHERGALGALSRWLDPAEVRGRWASLPTVQNRPPASGSPRIAVCLHLFYPRLWPEIHAWLTALPEPFDLVVTLPDFAATPELEAMAREMPRLRFAPMPNRGRDVLPWLRLLAGGTFEPYEFVCKLHGKLSPHSGAGAQWRQQHLAGLIGSRQESTDLLRAMRAAPAVGLVGAAAAVMSPAQDAWRAQSLRHLRRLEAALGQPGSAGRWPFFTGTMFWFRPAALRALAAMQLPESAFAPEMGQTDGTLPHAIERFVVALAASGGYGSAAWHAPGRRLEPLEPVGAERLAPNRR